MGWNAWVRRIHRWMSVIFTLAVIANFIIMAAHQPPAWVVYAPLVPLFLLLCSGIYLFILPYAAHRPAAARGAID